VEKVEIKRSIWINAPRERVWKAIADPAQIAQWFAPGVDFSRKDDILSIRMGDTDIEVAIVEVVDPPRQLTTRSLPDRLITTTYLLEEENGGTRVTVRESGLELLPETERKQRIEQNGPTWDVALENLKAFIDGKPMPRPEGF
jgi:uncharacterized protein YndB with AHSA1/START domain